MSLLTGIILLCVLLSGFFMTIPSRPHRNVILENTIPKFRQKEPQIQAVVKSYRKMIYLVTLVYALLSLSIAIIPYDSIAMTIFIMLLFSDIAVLYLLEIRYIGKMREVLVKNDWLLAVEPLIVDTRVVIDKNRKILSLGWLIGSLILTIASSLFIVQKVGLGDGNGLLIFINAVLWLLFAACYYAIYKLPAKAMTDETTINQQYNDLTKFHWSLLIVVFSYLFIPINLLPYLPNTTATWLNLFISGYFLVVLGASVWSIYLLFSLRKKQEYLLNQAATQYYTGEDQYWRYGFYYNPNDQRLMIPDRVGMNIGMNMAKKSAQILMGLTLIFLAGILIYTTAPLYQYDFGDNSIDFTLQDQTIKMTAPMAGNAEVKLSDIEVVELVDQLPSGMRRTNGLGTDRYAMGQFSADGKPATLYVRQDQDKILHLVTSDRDYYYTGETEAETAKIYQQIITKLN